MVWLNAAATRILAEADILARLQTALDALHHEAGGSSMVPAALLVLQHPPSIDDGEITDKGYINQRAVLERRAVQVEQLHAGGSGVISASAKSPAAR